MVLFALSSPWPATRLQLAALVQGLLELSWAKLLIRKEIGERGEREAKMELAGAGARPRSCKGWGYAPFQEWVPREGAEGAFVRREGFSPRHPYFGIPGAEGPKR